MSVFSVERDGDLWRVVSHSGEIVACGLTNSAAWRKADILANEAISAAEAKKETLRAASIDEQRETYAALIGEAAMKGYDSGWVAHAFKRKFAKWPCNVSGLTNKDAQ